jgi:hypothetical protein
VKITSPITPIFHVRLIAASRTSSTLPQAFL